MLPFMNKTLIYILMITGLMATSCKKHLDIVPVGRVLPQTMADFRAVLTQAYASPMMERGIASFRSDEIKLDEDNSFGVANVANNFIWNENSNENPSVTQDWTSQYRIIFYSNIVIEEGPTAKEAVTADLNQLIGEAHLLRAYTYFNLVNLFGPVYNSATASTDKAVPLITEVDLEKVGERNTVKDIYDQILRDIAAGKGLLNKESFDKAFSYRFTTVAADALEARVNLYMKNYTAARDAALRVMQKKNTLVDLNVIGALLPNDYSSVETILALEKNYSFSLTDAMRVSDGLQALYNAGDKRLSTYYTSGSNGLEVVKVANDKYRTSFRVGEVYLIAAEAQAALDNDVEARKYLNALKKVRLTPEYYATEETRINGLSGQTLLNEIMAERARELAFEGHRWFDLRRNGQPSITHILDGQTYILTANDPRYVIRIPNEAVANNGLLLR